MKIALFTFIALVVGTLAQNNNNNCLLGSGAPGTSCSTNNQCVTGLSCVNGLCNFVNLGQVCSSDAQCGGLYPFCIGGRCDAKRIPGDPCSMNEQCISNTCSSGACLARQLNEACGGSDCAPGLYCSATTRVCTSKIAVGASCSNEYVAMVSNIAFAHDLSVMCTDSALCDYNPNSSINTGVCTPIFSANEGSCGAFGAFTCPVGSTCNGNSCVGISGNNGNECGVNAQCSGITTFCACTGNNNNNFQVFNSSNTGVVTAIRQLGGASVGTQGASANVAGAGTSVGTQGASANVAGVGASVGTQGAAVGTQGTAVGVGQNGAAVGTQGAAVGVGQNGVAVGTQGAAVGVGQNGVAAGTQGTGVVVGSNGAVVGTQGTTVVINTANFQGRCRNDQCLNSYSPDYYSCLLQNGCGLSTSPVLISGTCANKCAFLYSRIQCCQAGYQPIISNNTNSENNRGPNSLQRSIALPPQIQCVQFSQPPEPSAAGVLEAGIAVLASLIGVMLF